MSLLVGAVMSSIANWSYNSVAIIRPLLGVDLMTQEKTYGPEYEIRCDWLGGPVQARSNNGEEYVGSYRVWHEDKRPKYLDWVVSIDGVTIEAECRTFENLPTSALGDPVSDFLMVLA